MTNFSITQHNSGGMLRLDVSGEVDTAASEELAAAIHSAITSGTQVLLTIDLDRVTFLDCAGINILVAGRRLADQHGVAYLVTNPNGLVRRVLEITGVLQQLSEPSADAPGQPGELRPRGRPIASRSPRPVPPEV